MWQWCGKDTGEQHEVSEKPLLIPHAFTEILHRLVFVREFDLLHARLRFQILADTHDLIGRESVLQINRHLDLIFKVRRHVVDIQHG